MAKKKIIGRPPKSAEEKRTSVLFFRFTAAENALIDQDAEQPAVWARNLILREANKRVKRKS